MLPYVPQKLPVINFRWEKLIPLVGKANASLSQYNGLLESMVNPHVLLASLTTKEATLSSKIEGTQATFSEVLEYEAGKTYDEEKEKDIREIRNYREAMSEAERLIAKDGCIHLNMLKALHRILLEGVRGANKARGQFRTCQNWIGKVGCSLREASYVPPNPIDMQDALTDWENYLNTDDADILIQLSVIHAQFELIHPFMDGNGRIGRMLIPLFLYMKRYLKFPVFYLSEFLEENREAYYETLRQISQSNDWQGWVVFFLNAIIRQSVRNVCRAKAILKLYDKMKDQIQSVTRSQYAVQCLDALFKQPVLSSAIFMKLTGIENRATANIILRKLEQHRILTVIAPKNGRTPIRYAFQELIACVNES